MHNLGSHVQYEDSHGSSQASSSFPCPSIVHGPTSQFFPSAGNVDISLKLDQVSYIFTNITNMIRSSYCVRTYWNVSSSFRPDNETFTLDDFDSLTPEEPAAQGDPDVLGYSQLGGAPLGISQQQTPQPLLRPKRQVRSPDRHTYSEGHVCAQQRAKRVQHPRGG